MGECRSRSLVPIHAIQPKKHCPASDLGTGLKMADNADCIIIPFISPPSRRRLPAVEQFGPDRPGNGNGFTITKYWRTESFRDATDRIRWYGTSHRLLYGAHIPFDLPRSFYRTSDGKDETRTMPTGRKDATEKATERQLQVSDKCLRCIS